MPDVPSYLCIDLKSFYASIECIERGLDPFTTNLVVADLSRTEQTICLAVSPAMKKLGVPGRCRVFEIPKSIEYIAAPPRMSLYIERAAEIYGIYLKYFSKEDIHVYSIDEAFFDVTHYLPYYGMPARQLARQMMDEIQQRMGVSSAAGIGPNLFLAKVALDIEAKHSPDAIAESDEMSSRMRLWNHTPITDFWRIGKGTERRLAALGIHTMGQLAAADEESIYGIFGVDAELLLDHAWGVEPTTIADIHAYIPKSTSISSGQVLSSDRTKDDALVLIKEMADSLAHELLGKGLVATGLSLAILEGKAEGRISVSGSERLDAPLTSNRELIAPAVGIYDRIVAEGAHVRRIGLAYSTEPEDAARQLTLEMDDEQEELLERDRALQEATIAIRRKFGKNSLLKALDLTEGATARERNRQIGGHRSGE
ncbi:MAG: DNA repair protein [Atopobiaceae bacterium]|nr:DNA repair protein [Atopobiaceae bacterium]